MSIAKLVRPFTLAVNPHLAEAEAVTAAWVVDSGLVADAAEVAPARYPLLAAMGWPVADAELLGLLSSLLTCLFVLDDDLDAKQGGTLDEVVMAVHNALDPTAGTATSTPGLLPPSVIALRGMAWDLQRVLTPAQYLRWRDAMAGWCLATAWGAALERSGTIPPVRDFLRNRPHGSGLYTVLCLNDAAAHFVLSEEHYADLRIQEYLRLAALQIAYANDLRSWAKEQAAENPQNMIAVWMANTGCPEPEAVAEVVTRHNDVAAALAHASAMVGPDLHPDQQRFLRGVQAWLAASVAWLPRSGRY